MSSTYDCNDIRPMLAEYAAGALDARERAVVEDHLVTCATCRTEADSYVDVADELLLLAPSSEPPVGFETSVMARIDRTPRRRYQRRSTALLAAAAAVVVLGLGVAIGRASAPPAPVSEQAISLRTAKGVMVGTAVVHRGEPGWIFVTMSYHEDWTVGVETVSLDGTVTHVGSLVVRGGHGSFGTTSPVALDQVRLIRMVESEGRVLCQAVVNT